MDSWTRMLKGQLAVAVVSTCSFGYYVIQRTCVGLDVGLEDVLLGLLIQ